MVGLSAGLVASTLSGCSDGEQTSSNKDEHGYEQRSMSLQSEYPVLRKGDRGQSVKWLHSYLENYGYFPNPSLTEHKGWQPAIAKTPGDTYLFDDITERAVMLFQKIHGLPPDGTLNEVTQKLLHMPRCGFPDVTGTTSVDGVDADRGSEPESYVFSGYRWPSTALTFSFQNYTPDLTTDLTRTAVIGAANRWAAVSRLSFAETTGGSIRISWQQGDHGDGSPFDGPSGVLAHAFYPTDGRLHFDDAETWTTSGSGIDLESVALHELGHSIGLGHSSNPSAVMYAYYSGPRRNLTDDDLQGVQAAYGENQLVKWPISDWGYDDRRWMADFNGDGKSDYCRATGASGGAGSYLTCAFSNGSGFPSQTSSQVWDWGYSDRRWMVDFNGDGKADYCRATGYSSGAGSYLTCALSNGSGFSTQVSMEIADWGYSDRRWFADRNGDGKADYCRATGLSSGVGSYLNCAYSTGVNLGRDMPIQIWDWGYGDRRWTADVTGDKKGDYCRAVGASAGSDSYLLCGG